MRKWFTSLPAKIVEIVLGAAITIAIADHYYDHIRLTTRTWVFGLAVFALVALTAAMAAVLLRRHQAGKTELVEADDRPDAYAEHARQILGHLSEVIANAIPNVSYESFIERGILEPARDMLRQDPEEDIRLSVLVPKGDTFVMPFAAGHSLPSKHKFSLAIKDSLARLAYEKGEICVWQDLEDEPAYVKHPLATRSYRSMISVPLRGVEGTYGVLNVISTVDHAFDDVDTGYVKTLGSLIDVAASLLLAEHRAGALPQPEQSD